MMDRPIIFSAPMIRALLDGRKTQTRRVLKMPTWAQVKGWPERIMDEQGLDGTLSWFCRDTGCLARLPIPQPGDRLWVKEAWNVFSFSEDGEEAWPCAKIPTADEYREIIEAAYRFDMQPIYRESDRARKWFADQKWRPSIHMPRWASRLTLLVTDVRVQLLQEISEEDSVAEGTESARGLHDIFCNGAPAHLDGYPGCDCETRTPRDTFSILWNSIHGPDAWGANPWVTAISFTVHKQNIDQMETPNEP